MKLYEVPRDTWVKSAEPDYNDTFFFKRIDGMYSCCEDLNGNTCHYVAWMEVDLVTSNPDGSLSDGMS